MTQVKLVLMMLDLVAKHAQQDTDRIDVPLLLLITACKVNGVTKDAIIEILRESYDDVTLIAEGASDSDVTKH